MCDHLVLVGLYTFPTVGLYTFPMVVSDAFTTSMKILTFLTTIITTLVYIFNLVNAKLHARYYTTSSMSNSPIKPIRWDIASGFNFQNFNVCLHQGEYINIVFREDVTYKLILSYTRTLDIQMIDIQGRTYVFVTLLGHLCNVICLATHRDKHILRISVDENITIPNLGC